MLTSDYEVEYNHNFITIASLGILSYYFTIMWHEIIGHGTQMYIFGSNHFILTSTSIDSPDINMGTTPGTWPARWIAMAGSVSNVGLALILYPFLAALRRNERAVSLRFALWLLITVNLSLGLVYPLYSGIFGVGDWSAAISGLAHQPVLRFAEILFSLAMVFISARVMASRLADFSGDHFWLTWTAYFSAIAVFCSIGLRNPDLHIILISVLPAPILGQLILFLAPFCVPARPNAAPDAAPTTAPAIPLHWPILMLALLAVALLWITAPGIDITV